MISLMICTCFNDSSIHTFILLVFLKFCFSLLSAWSNVYLLFLWMPWKGKGEISFFHKNKQLFLHDWLIDWLAFSFSIDKPCYFYNISSCPLQDTLLSIAAIRQDCLNFYSVIVNLQIRMSKQVPTFCIFFFNGILAVWGLLFFHINFEITGQVPQ